MLSLKTALSRTQQQTSKNNIGFWVLNSLSLSPMKDANGPATAHHISFMGRCAPGPTCSFNQISYTGHPRVTEAGPGCKNRLWETAK